MYCQRSILLILAGLLSIICNSCQFQEDLLSPKEREWLKEHPNLIAAVNPTYPPYQYINDKGELDGIFVGFMHLIEERIGYEFKRKLYDNWNEVIIDAKGAKVDLILEIQETKDRLEYLHFTPSLVSQPHVIVTEKNTKSNSKIDWFNGKRVGVIRNYSTEEYLRKNYPKFEIISVANDVEGYSMLAHHELDAFVSFRAIANYFINQKGYHNFEIDRELAYLNKVSIGNLREYDILSNIMTKAVNSITAKERKQVFESWSYTLVKPIYQRLSFWFTLIGLMLGVLLLYVSINIVLKRIVKEQTEELRIAKNLAEEGSRLKTTFLQNISHEVRTPLNAIVGFSDMITKGVIDKEEQSKFLNVIKHSGEQLISVIDDILEISNLDTKKIKTHYSSVNVSEIFSELAAIYEVQTLKKGLILNLKGPENLYAVTDGSKLRKVISILIDNAIKNTIKGKIDVCFWGKEDILKFSVRDTGNGIEENVLSNIFERFEKSSKEIKDLDEGIGLGLSIAKENVLLLNGRINVTSKIKEGSTFEVEIPYKKGKKTTEDIDRDRISELKIKSILIAEDGKINFIVLKRSLMQLLGNEIEISHAENGAIAVEQVLINRDFDLILMDIKMPVMDGYEAIRRIKAENIDIPIIAQTAYATPEDLQKALDSGCSGVVTKPIKIEKLAEVLIEVVLD